MMPVKSGYEVCQRMRERPEWRHIKIVMLSAKGREAEVSKGMSLGADLYITKPFSTQELINAINAFFDPDTRSRTAHERDAELLGLAGRLLCGDPRGRGAFALVASVGDRRGAATRDRRACSPRRRRRWSTRPIILLFVCAGVLRWVFRRYPEAARQLAEQTRVLLAASPEHKVAAAGGPEMVELAAAINQLADGYHRLERDLDARSADARARVEEERNRFAALMSELSEGVVVCNADGRILLYNARAAKLVGSAERRPRGAITRRWASAARCSGCSTAIRWRTRSTRSSNSSNGRSSVRTRAS